MKIGIQTHPLKTNYGGILQAFALQYWLDSMGYDTIHLNRVFKAADWILRMKHIAYNIVYHREVNIRRKAESVFQPFIEQYIRMSPKLKSHKKWTRFILDNQFYAVVTGSDQVWRKEYTGAYLNEYFLNFAKGEIKKIAFAASFGVDKIDAEYASEIRELLKDFDAISVREKSGVNILKDNFNLEATHLLDPTMMLTADDYVKIFDLKKETNSPFIFAYVLDKNRDKQEIIDVVERDLGLSSRFVYGAEVTKENWRDKDIAGKVTIEQWLQNFYNADFVVTDSFHGTVFSIIFNKPFIAIGNKDRGLTRFKSLVDLFNLSDRLVFELGDIDLEKINHDIDYENINHIIAKEQNKVKSFFDKTNNYE